MKKLVILFFVFLISETTNSQSLMVGAGLATDINNPDKSFNFIPLEIQWYPFEKATLSLMCNYDLGLNAHSTGDAYTLSPQSPAHVTLRENYRMNLLTIGLSLNMGLYTAANHNKVYLFFVPLAFCFQSFKASYKNYDNKNYEILDPDVSKKYDGMVMMYGLQYHFNGNKQLAVHVQTPLLSVHDKSFNYKYAAPFRLMFGYHFNYKKER